MSNCKVIAISNQKGGVGKTTTTLSLGVALSKLGKKVLLLDADPQGDLTICMGYYEQEKMKTLATLMGSYINDIPLDVNDVILHHKENIDLIPSNLDLSAMEIPLLSAMNREVIVRNCLEKIKDNYDYITIDCPPSLGLITINAFTASDSVMIPIQCEFFALEGLSQLMNTIRLVKKKLNPEIVIDGVVLTMFTNRSNLGRQVAEEINKFFADTVFKTTIPRNVRLAESPSYGEPVYVYDKNCLGSKAYQALVEEYFDRNNVKYIKLS